jgi:hypothetical protein
VGRKWSEIIEQLGVGECIGGEMGRIWLGKGVGGGGSVCVDFSDCAFYPSYKSSAIATELKTWADGPFEHRDELVNVTPKPLSKPHPFFFIGGMRKAVVRRVARFGAADDHAGY